MMNRTSGRIVWAVVCAAVFLGGLACASAPKPDPACQGAACDPQGCICEEGTRQSPIDLVGAVPTAGLPGLVFEYPERVAVRLADTRTTLKATAVAPVGARLIVGGERYDLDELHFHHPGEHRVGSSTWAMELHLVHANALGEPAAVGVFLRAFGDRPHPVVEEIWRRAPPRGGAPVLLDLRVADLLPPDTNSYFRYAGSLTTEPCTEGVRWFMLRDETVISTEQAATYRYPESARSIQPLNGRPVLLRPAG